MLCATIGMGLMVFLRGSFGLLLHHALASLVANELQYSPMLLLFLFILLCPANKFIYILFLFIFFFLCILILKIPPRLTCSGLLV
ncbi:hypothetical protein BDV27DRAFT_131232, partial [Aspergillus caelatus]